MDQQKMLRLLRLLMKLSGKRWCSLREIVSVLDCSERTTYRYLETFETAGFLLERNKGSYRLQKDNANWRSLQSLMHFSEEELVI